MTDPKNLYIRTVSLNNRKSCPTCNCKLNGESIYSSGEYKNGKWKTTDHFCKNCFDSLKEKIKLYNERTSRIVEFKGYGSTKIPNWMD